MNRTGHADMPLHGGRVPYWLASRMELLGGAIAEVIVEEYGREGFFTRLSDPRWFQSFGCVLGMDWHSSGITTSVMGALRRAFDRKQRHLGLRVCGGRGNASRRTPAELMQYAGENGLDGNSLARASRLSAKVDNTAVQDGFQLYLHSFVIDKTGMWAVVQQGMDNATGMARRYHWFSGKISSYTRMPHMAVAGIPKGPILNLTAIEADPTKKAILSLIRERPELIQHEARKILMPGHHDVRRSDVNLKRLGAVLSVAYEQHVPEFDDLLLTQGLGPRTLQSLVLVSEVIHGTPSRFDDPARYSMAHGGKDGHPFPVPTKVYDQTIAQMDRIINKSRIQQSDKSRALKSLHLMAKSLEKDIQPDPSKFDKFIQREKELSRQWGGRTAAGPAVKPDGQLSLFR
ncbi:DUF763 domain-containing protein [Fulvivirga sedimenti]|uniref:DUF763 domain-containing protein n=1 Tax=Fulvivirga sedimenti TaxID=2879465 RepID=A0A9X1HWD1_9BACT|nr:DUF763 domain-containing protein [Fulvivirga sedimenti]MCA6078866.1 DUF763 domain-containing protein [Fulvivirga sedimenti]